MIQIKDIYGKVIAEIDTTSLKTAKFKNLNLENADFRGMDLSFATFFGTNLNGADFSGADLSYATLSYEQKKSIIYDKSTKFQLDYYRHPCWM